MAKSASCMEWGCATGFILFCLASCEGKHRPYPTGPLQQPDAASSLSPEQAEPALTPATSTPENPAASTPENIGEGTRLPDLSASSAGASSGNSTPNSANPDTTEDAGAAAPTPSVCNCSNTPERPLCKTTPDGNPALLNTCVECLSSADCFDPAASRCDPQTGLCAACRGNSDCTGIAGKPFCNASTNLRCVECQTNLDCTGNPNGSRCNTATNSCAECVTDADCPTPGASRCADSRCQPCVNDAAGSHCGHVIGDNAVLGVCDVSGATGACVQCTGTQSAACGAAICNSLMKTCSAFAPASAGTCQPCVSDAQCAAGNQCVLETFGGASLGYSCFPLKPAGNCPGFPYTESTNLISMDGKAVDVCLLRHTTCQGVNRAQSSEPCTVDTDCGEVGLDDGVCNTALANGICTVPCSLPVDCVNALLICEAGVCIPPM